MSPTHSLFCITLVSGFPTLERHPIDKYSTHPANLNNIPFLPESLFCHIKTDILGMMVPWLHVGMCFSTFCWHNEDHYAYSIDYMHWGETRTWYGVPASDAVKFEDTMRKAVPELFEQQPDLLFHLSTMLSPERLVANGVKVVALDQRPGQLVVTFPQAYHAGFNQGVSLRSYKSLDPHTIVHRLTNITHLAGSSTLQKPSILHRLTGAITVWNAFSATKTIERIQSFRMTN
jgi:hypothetical protein